MGHATIRKALKPLGLGVATGEVSMETISHIRLTRQHINNRIMFKQLLQLDAIDAVQLDSQRLGGLPEIFAVLLMAAKFGVPVVPHAGWVHRH